MRSGGVLRQEIEVARFAQCFFWSTMLFNWGPTTRPLYRRNTIQPVCIVVLFDHGGVHLVALSVYYCSTIVRSVRKKTSTGYRNNAIFIVRVRTQRRASRWSPIWLLTYAPGWPGIVSKLGSKLYFDWVYVVGGPISSICRLAASWLYMLYLPAVNMKRVFKAKFVRNNTWNHNMVWKHPHQPWDRTWYIFASLVWSDTSFARATGCTGFI